MMFSEFPPWVEGVRQDLLSAVARLRMPLRSLARSEGATTSPVEDSKEPGFGSGHVRPASSAV